jgi:hypothetical protein
MRRTLLALVASALPSLACASPILVDIGQENGRRDVLTRGAINWIVPKDGKPELTKDLGEGITATLTSSAPLEGVLWKGGLDTGATLACDGVRATAAVRLAISGLSAGKHRVSLASSNTDKADVPDFSVVVNGTAHPAAQLMRAQHDEDTWIASFEVDAVAGQPVVIMLEPAAGASLTLNGFEIDGLNRLLLPKRLTPSDGDEHIVDRTPTLRWEPADLATVYRVHFGESPDGLQSKGEQATTTWAVPTELDPSKTYYWRVDSVSANGVTPGEVYRFRVAQLAFPGAEGWGRFARGGRGGRVIQVTNLNDAGPGSLREAVEAEGPRTIVFRVGGVIQLKDRLVIKNPYCTVAGQTAPGEGIAIRGAAFGMGGTHDVIMRYIRLRVGDESGKTWDGMGFAGSDHCIIDHCSIAWSIDEGVSSRGAKNITFQRSIIAEPLNMSVHDHYKGTGKGHSFAGSIGGDIGSFHSNLLANAAGRNWSLAGGLTQGGKFAGRLDIRNNVVFNWAHRTNDGGVRAANIVDNYYIPGPATKVFHTLIAKMELRLPDDVQQYYVAGNVMEGKYDGSDNWSTGVTIDPADLSAMKLTQPFCESFVTLRTAKEAYDSVIRDVGANIPMPDAIDRRTIDNVIHRTTTFAGSKTGMPGIIDSQADVGGYPGLKGGDPYPDADADGMDDRWETAHSLNPRNPDDRNAIHTEGYTYLESYLNWIVENGGVEPK